MEIKMNIPSLYKSLLAVSVLAVGMAGCNTVSGVGKDIAGIGNFISGGADETQEAVFGPGEDYGSPSTLGQSEAPETQTGMTTDSQTQSSGQTSTSSTPGTSSSTQMSGTTEMEPASGQSVVYFDSGSASLSSSSREELRAALAQQRFGSQTRIQVIGYADSVGAPEVNERLSQRRAEAVAAELAMLGVPRDAVEVTWRGESQLAVATGDEVPEAENRRVTIQYAPTVAQTY
jgi:outer membrane protein OmpA-like peptidoglycan-associated protein